MAPAAAPWRCLKAGVYRANQDLGLGGRGGDGNRVRFRTGGGLAVQPAGTLPRVVRGDRVVLGSRRRLLSDSLVRRSRSRVSLSHRGVRGAVGTRPSDLPRRCLARSRDGGPPRNSPRPPRTVGPSQSAIWRRLPPDVGLMAVRSSIESAGSPPNRPRLTPVGQGTVKKVATAAEASAKKCAKVDDSRTAGRCSGFTDPRSSVPGVAIPFEDRTSRPEVFVG